jgi:DNA-binding XRE family transcriptional regulator
MIAELKKYRECMGLTQPDMAEILGVSDSTYSKWERGKVEPRGLNKLNIQKFLREKKEKT